MLQGVAHLLDVGSTWTKGVAVSLTDGTLLARHQEPTSTGPGVMVAANAVIDALSAAHAGPVTFRAATSSAAGGLRIAALGLVPDLTGTAARQASLGAGARVVFSGSYGLTEADVEGIRAAAADIILLTGGTDGGNTAVLLENAQVLARAHLDAAVVLAGNRNAQPRAQALLIEAGYEVRLADNVLPALDEMRAESAQATIRDLFLERIVLARGIEELRDWAGGRLSPTPRAVLEAAALLADGEARFGTTVVVDIGGATTDVHSIGAETPAPGVILRGLREPHQKRTVEGDLGLRVSAHAAVESLDGAQVAQPEAQRHGGRPSPRELMVLSQLGGCQISFE